MFTEGTFGGNRDLSEETATTWTAGVVLRPEFASGLTVSLDWYDIEIEDAINTPEAEELTRAVRRPAHARQPVLPRHRRAIRIRASSSASRVRPDNVASFHTAGLDVAIDYRIETDSAGEFRVQLVGGYLDKLEFVVHAGRGSG